MTYQTFDADDVMAEFGDVDVVCELVAIVRNDLESYIATVTAATAEHHVGRAREVVHAIKGAVANVSAGAARDLAAQVETRLRAGDETALTDVPALVLECQKLRAELGLWLEALGCTTSVSH